MTLTFDNFVNYIKILHIKFFWTLTANRKGLNLPIVLEPAKKKILNPQALMRSFTLSVEHVMPLDRTTSRENMMQDVAII